MYDIVSLFSVLYPHLSKTTLRQFSGMVFGLLLMTGRVSMLNISRWTSAGGSYRTLQRFFNTVMPWGSLFWVFFSTYLLDRESTYILAGDETVVSKSGPSTYGLGRFFSSTHGKTIPGLAFLGLSLVSVKERRSYPMVMEQIVRGDTVGFPSPPALEPRDAIQTPSPAHNRGRPKGSQNRNKAAVQQQIAPKYRVSTQTHANITTQVYQATLRHKKFPGPLNVVCILKTHLQTHRKSHVLLFSSDLALAPEKIIDYYSLRFQIEFNFREAKQYWGLEDFMNINETPVNNAANLSMFMVNVSAKLLTPLRLEHAELSVLDLKARYRGLKYLHKTLKILPQNPKPIVIDQIAERLGAIGAIHHTPAQLNTS